MKVLLVFPSKVPATGNVSTIHRIHKHLVAEGFKSIVKDVNSISPDASSCPRHQLCRFALQEDVGGILFLHAFKAGKIVLCTCAHMKGGSCVQSLPFIYGIIFGGTDLNLDITDPEKFCTMQKVLKEASSAVAFTEVLERKSLQVCPNLKVHVQPQSIEIPEFHNGFKDPNDNVLNNFESSREFYTFLIVTGIRPVKDPMFVLESWIKLCEENKELNLKMLIIGPVLNEKFAETFFQFLESMKALHLSPDILKPVPQSLEGLSSWMRDRSAFPILYMQPLSPDDLRGLFYANQIFASVNSSVSEGMASSILESMAHRIPVIARDNDGNKAVITDEETGLLFHTPRDFAIQALKLIKSPQLWKSISENAFYHILKHHSPPVERKFYGNICRTYFCIRENSSIKL